jgi:hypothetical protein
MSEIQFNEESNLDSQFTSRTILGAPTSPKMVKALLKTGIVKNEKSAGYLLLGFAVVCLILAFYISYTFLYTKNAPKKLTPEQEKQRQDFMDRVNQNRPQ